MEKTFKLEVNKTVTETLEVILPLYRKTNAHFYKVFSQKSCIQVTDMGPASDNNTIQIAHAGMAWVGDSGQESTKEEFDEAYARIKAGIDKLAYD